MLGGRAGLRLRVTVTRAPANPGPVRARLVKKAASPRCTRAGAPHPGKIRSSSRAGARRRLCTRRSRVRSGRYVVRADGWIGLVIGFTVIRLDEQDVLSARGQPVRNIKAERGERAPVLAEFLSIQPHVGDDAGGAELEPAARTFRRRVEFESIPADAPPIRFSRVEAGGVVGIPSVWQADRLPVSARRTQCRLVGERIVLNELPVLHQTGRRSQFLCIHA